MSRSLLVAFLAAAFLVVPAALPIAFAPAIAPGFSGLAQAATNLNSSRSNVNRMGGGGGTTKRQGTTKQPTKGGKGGGAPRMGGGGGGGGRSGGY
jgi:hypothetical protein